MQKGSGCKGGSRYGMIALIKNISGIDGSVQITLYQDKDKHFASVRRNYLEHLFRNEPKVSVFTLEAESLPAMMKTHRVWFDKLENG